MQKRTTTPASIIRIALWLFVLYFVLQSFTSLFLLPSPKSDALFWHEDTSARVEGTVVDVSLSGEQQITVKDVVLDGEMYSGKMRVSVPQFPRHTYGDRLRFRCTLNSPEPFDGFQYDKFLAGKRIYKTCFIHEAPLLISEQNQPYVLQAIHDARSFVIDVTNTIFGEPHGSLAIGLLFGDTSFSSQWDARFSRTGISHIVAASGYNVSLVAFILFGVLTTLGIRRQRAFWFLLLGIAGYVIVAGGDAAVIRAGIMGSLVLLARHVGRKAPMDRILLITVVAMLFINPFLLRYDVGFQLSVASTVALLYVAPSIEKYVKFLPEAYAIRESASATIAATIFTLPIILLSFGTVSIIGIFANILVLPVVPYAMLFSILAIGIGAVWHKGGIIFSGLAWVLLSFILLIVYMLAEVPMAFWEVPEVVRIPLALVVVIIMIFLVWKSGSKNN